MVDCTSEILKKYAERGASKSQVDALLQDLRHARKISELMPEKGTYDELAQQALNRRIQGLSDSANARAYDLQKKLDIKRFISQDVFSGNPEQGFLAYIRQENALAVGSRSSLEDTIDSYLSYYREPVEVQLRKQGLDKLFVSGAEDAGIRIALKKLNQGINVDQAIDGVSREAVAMAKIIHTVNKRVLRDARALNIPLGELTEFTTLQTHDPKLFIKNDDIEGSRKAFVEYMQSVPREAYNADRFHGNALGDPEAEAKSFAQFFDEVTGGTNISDDMGIDDDMLSFDEISTNVSEATARKRRLVFTDGQWEAKYAKDYGGKTFAEAFTSYVNNKSKHFAMIDKFGTKPRQVLENAIKEVADGLRQSNPELASQLARPTGERTMFSERIMRAYEDVTSSGTSILTRKARNITAGIRLSQSLSLLAYSGFAQLTNFANTAAALRNANGENFFEASIKTALSSIWPSIRGRKDEIAALGYVMDDLTREILRQQQGGLLGKGKKLLGALYRVNGAELIDTAAVHTFMTDFQYSLHRKFDTPEVKSTLLSAGIMEQDLPILREAFEDLGDGRRVMTLEAISSLQNTPELTARARQMRMTPEQYKTSMRSRFGAMLARYAKDVRALPGSKERTALSPKFTSTTAQVLFDLGTQFKEYSLSTVNNIIRNSGNRANLDAIKNGLLTAERGSSAKFMDVGSSLVMLTTFSAVGMALRELVKSTPDAVSKGDAGELRVPKVTPEFVIEALARSGAGGLYVDMVGQTIRRDNPDAAQVVGSMLMGPAVSPLAELSVDAISAAFKATEGDDRATRKSLKNLTKTAAKTARQFVPFQNAPFVKQGIDHLMNEVVLENLYPGSTRRGKAMMEKRQRENSIYPLKE